MLRRIGSLKANLRNKTNLLYNKKHSNLDLNPFKFTFLKRPQTNLNSIT